MKKVCRRILAVLLSGIMLFSAVSVCVAADTSYVYDENTGICYKLEVVSFIRGQVDDLRCCELFEARLYQSTDGGVTWTVCTEIDGQPVSNFTYTWYNGSSNTLMCVYTSHDLADVEYDSNAFSAGSVEVEGGQWAALKTPGQTTGGGSQGGRPGQGSSGSSSSSQEYDGGAVYASVELEFGDYSLTVTSDQLTSFEAPSLEADVQNIALALFVGDEASLVDLLAESAIVHINCNQCYLSDVTMEIIDGVTEEDLTVEDIITLEEQTSSSGGSSQGGRPGQGGNRPGSSQQTTTAWYVTGLQKGVVQISMNIDKGSCTVHNGQEVDLSCRIYVFEKPETVPTTTTITLTADTVDQDCRYFIDGVEGTYNTDGSITFFNLTPDTTYSVTVQAEYQDYDDDNNLYTRYAYAFVEETTLTETYWAVTFHANLKGVDDSIFRVYYSADMTDLPDVDYAYNLNGDNSVDTFYDIPELGEYHNSYIFKGWYLDQDNENDNRPISWEDTYTEDTAVYAHWIEVGTVAQEDDGKVGIENGTYAGFDLVGTQIRYDTTDTGYYDYTENQTGADAGLRYIAVLSENVWQQLLGVHEDNPDSAQYGIVMAKATTADKYCQSSGEADYQLLCKDSQANGTDTTATYKYVKNLACTSTYGGTYTGSGIAGDHFNGENYRLYTAVLTYTSYTTEEALAAAYELEFAARAYLRYTDANGLLRIYYNNYSEDTAVYDSCSASYNEVSQLTQEAAG